MRFTFQQGNNKCTPRANVLKWPNWSPDLNPAENMHQYLLFLCEAELGGKQVEKQPPKQAAAVTVKDVSSIYLLSGMEYKCAPFDFYLRHLCVNQAIFDVCKEILDWVYLWSDTGEKLQSINTGMSKHHPV